MKDTYGIIVDDSAIERIAALRKTGSGDFSTGTLLRVMVEGGGCSGFQYKIEPAQDIADDDIIFNDAVVIDELSAQYLKNSRIVFKNDLMSAMFVVDNPNAVSSCGCSASFALDPAALFDSGEKTAS